ADELLAGSQEDFPEVAQNGEAGGEAGVVLGMLPRGVLLRALANGGLEATVGESMIRGCAVASEGAPVEVAYRRLRELDCGAVLERGGRWRARRRGGGWGGRCGSRWSAGALWRARGTRWRWRTGGCGNWTAGRCRWCGTGGSWGWCRWGSSRSW